MSILARSRDTDSARPVVVEVGKFVCKLLQYNKSHDLITQKTHYLEMVWLQPRCILDNIVTGGIDGSLSDGLRYKEEVVSLWQCHYVVHYRPTRRIRGFSIHPK